MGNDFPLIILKNIIILPRSLTPVIVGRDFSVDAVEQASLHFEKKVVVAFQKQPDNNITIDTLYPFGVMANILQVIKSDKSLYKILLEGIGRVKINSIHGGQNDNKAFFASCTHILTPALENNFELYGAIKNFEKYYKEYGTYYEKSIIDMSFVDIIDRPELLEASLDIAASCILYKNSDKSLYLSLDSVIDRIMFLIKELVSKIEVAKAEAKIKTAVQTQIESAQKEYYLQEQLKAIQKELKRDNFDSPADEYREIFEKKKNEYPEKIAALIQKEISRLEYIQSTSPEATIIRNYIEWLLNLPWKNESEDKVNIQEAQKILDTNHFGLAKVKERIIELLAAQKYSQGKIKSAIICFVGPPGVGKTSLAKSIAKSLNRDFISISLGGIRDEAEIRGHRKTYIGAMPGKIIRAFKKSTNVNPVILLDEIDKITHDAHGDPSAALLEVLDYTQNKQFLDHYLDVEYDLSKTIFIATANSIESIPYPLFDRMEIINISGYTNTEKLHIAKDFLIPRQLAEHTISSHQFFITDEALLLLINEYTKEAGVRQLERLIVRIIRKSIMTYLMQNNSNADDKETVAINTTPISICINTEEITSFLKTPLFKIESNVSEERQPGIATGLAWTELGGDILDIEVAITPGKGNVTITGQLGEIMQESAQAALTYVKTKAKELKIPKNKFSQCDIHIHVPEGATPKDGPSAGITMCSALISAFTKIPVKKNVAMTGEITLQGRILSIGGLKEKILAAILNGFDTICVPLKNKDQCDEICIELEEEVKKLKIYFVNSMNDIIPLVFTKNVLEIAHSECDTCNLTGTKDIKIKKNNIPQKKRNISRNISLNK